MADGAPELSPDELVDLADQLRELGVEEFTFRGATVKFKRDIALPRTISASEPSRHEPKTETLEQRAERYGLGRPKWPGQE